MILKWEGWWEPSHWSGGIALAIFFSDAAITGTLLPFFVDDVLGADRVWVSTALTCQYASAAIGQVVTGLLADRFGHRGALAALMVLNAVFLNVEGWCTTVTTFLAARICLGFVSTPAMALTWVADVSAPNVLAVRLSRAMLLAQSSVCVSGFVSGFLRGKDFRIACGALSALPLMNCVLLLGAREVKKGVSISGGHAVRDLGVILRQASFQAAVWNVMTHGYFLGFVLTLPPMLLKEVHGLPASAAGRIFQIGGFLTVVGHIFVTHRIASRFPVRGHQVITVVLAGLVIVLGVVGDRIAVAVYLLSAVAYTGNFIGLGVASFLVVLAAKKYSPESVGAVNGIARSILTIGSASAPIVVMAFEEIAGAWLPCLSTAVVFVIGAFALSAARVMDDLPVPVSSTQQSSAQLSPVQSPTQPPPTTQPPSQQLSAESLKTNFTKEAGELDKSSSKGNIEEAPQLTIFGTTACTSSTVREKEEHSKIVVYGDAKRVGRSVCFFPCLPGP